MSAQRNNHTCMPIWCDANRLLLSRAMAANGSQRRQRVDQLLGVVGDIKITRQLAKELNAFANFARFSADFRARCIHGQTGWPHGCGISFQPAPGRNPGADVGLGGAPVRPAASTTAAGMTAKSGKVLNA